ncbi:MAG: undecaprenyl-diphosphate phosphatase [Planctomycetes bacterium]|nr:undecaprenyl-diphosphate phosphatase [Planctomycetota bacterium]
MELWHAVILGLVEGITEYLPVSSTGHLIITKSLLGLNSEETRASVDAFLVVIQGGAILAVLGLYWKRIKQMLLGLIGRDPVGLRLAINIVIAFIPAAILGVLLDEKIEYYLFHTWPVIAALALGGVWMIWLDYSQRKRAEVQDTAPTVTIETLTPLRALAIGLLQCVAMWPGTSRSMMTIAGGTMLGLKPKEAAEFSFLLGLPTLGGACCFKLYKNLMETSGPDSQNMFEQLGWVPTIVGIAVATVSAALAVKWLVSFLTKHGLAPFGWYRLVLSAVLLVLILTKVVSITGAS